MKPATTGPRANRSDHGSASPSLIVPARTARAALRRNPRIWSAVSKYGRNRRREVRFAHHKADPCRWLIKTLEPGNG